MGNRKKVFACSGAYAYSEDDVYKPVSLTIDDGTPVNQNLYEKMDGLVVVYATGGIVVADIDKGVKVFGGGLSEDGETLHLRNHPR